MNYAIQELKNWSLNYGTCLQLKDYSLECKNAYQSLMYKKQTDVSNEIIKDLNDSLERVLNGLSSWGSEHLDAKKRQLKKAEELKEAILFFKPNYK